MLKWTFQTPLSGTQLEHALPIHSMIKYPSHAIPTYSCIWPGFWLLSNWQILFRSKYITALYIPTVKYCHGTKNSVIFLLALMKLNRSNTAWKRSSNKSVWKIYQKNRDGNVRLPELKKRKKTAKKLDLPAAAENLCHLELSLFRP